MSKKQKAEIDLMVRMIECECRMLRFMNVGLSADVIETATRRISDVLAGECDE